MKRDDHESSPSVSSRTPCASSIRTREFGRACLNASSSPPPVPTTICTTPRASSGVAVRRLGGELLVVVVVTDQDQLGVRRVQLVPERADSPGIAVLAAAEARLVHERDRASGAARCQVLAEPAHLVRLAATEVSEEATAAVEDHDVPCPKVIREPGPPIPSRGAAHVRPEGLAAVGMHVVVAGDGEPDPVLHATPRSTEALLELLRGAIRVGSVAEGGHDAWEAGRQGARGIVSGGVAATDVPGRDQGDGAGTCPGRGGRPGRGRRGDRGPLRLDGGGRWRRRW